MRRGLAAGVICLGLLSQAGAAHAAGCAPPSLRETVDTGGVLVHYTTDPASPNAVSAADAQTLAANAQAALVAETTQLAMPGPLPDSDGKQDVYVGSTAGCTAATPTGITVPRNFTAPVSDAYIIITKDKITQKLTIAHEMFHALQMAVSRGGKRAIVEGTAEWASRHLYPSEGATRDFDPGVPLDCSDKACGVAPYDTWPFFEFLSERYGASIGFRIFQTYAALGNQASATEVLDATLAPLGSSASAAYRDFSSAYLGDRITHPQLRDTSGATFEDQFATGTKARKVPGRRYQIDHLSARFLEVFATDRSGRCKPGTLALTIKAPGAPGAAAILNLKGHARAIAFKGGVGRLTVRWPLCEAASAGLALVNGSSAGGIQTFTLSAVVKPR